MGALKALAFTPISVLSDKRTTTEPKKIPSLPSSSTLKSSLYAHFSNNPQSFHGGLVLLSSFISSGFAKALTYEEALQQTVTTLSNDTPFDFDAFINSAISFGSENPVVVAGGAAVLAVPLILSKLLGKAKAWGVESAKKAYAKLGEDENAQLVDIRESGEIRKVGSPDIRGLKKKPVAITYKGEDKPGFLKKLALKFKEPESTTLIVLDKFDGSSELVAELVTANGFKAAYAVKDGAEGRRGWMNSGLPWIAPNKSFSLDLSSFTDALGEESDTWFVALGVVAATGLGLFAFAEVETILQVLGSAALIQLISKKLLLAEDRKATLQQVDEFLNTKVAPKELVGELKEIGKALLPSPSTGKALPAPVETRPSPVQAAEAVAESNSVPPIVQAAEAPTPQVNSVPVAEVKKDPLPAISRPLSPYPQYPDFKPPTSPTPSQP
ncbi:hypothetical protein LguiA_010472 [Lonicera macranthoides]